MSSSKPVYLKGTLRQVFSILPPPLHVYVYTVYLFTQRREGGGRIEPERRLEGQKFTKLG